MKKLLILFGLLLSLISFSDASEFNSLRSLPIDDPECPNCFVSLGETTRIYHPITDAMDMTLVGVTSSGLVIKRKLSGITESILFEKLILTRARLHYKVLTDSGIETKSINIKIKPQFNST